MNARPVEAESLNHGDQKPLVVASRLSLNPLSEVLAVPRPVRLLDRLLVAAVPVDPDDAVDEMPIMRTSTCHSVLQTLSICHGPVESARKDEMQSVLHVTRELRVDGLHKRLMVAALIGFRNRTELAVGLLRKHLACVDGVLVQTNRSASHGVLKFRSSLLDLLRNDWCRFLMPGACNEHDKQRLGAGREVVLKRSLEIPVVHLPVLRPDGVDIGITTAAEDIVQIRLLGSHALHTVVEGVTILLKWTARDSEERIPKVAAGLLLQITQQIPHKALIISMAN